MAREMNQAAWRRDRNIKDEFGRLWLVAFEVGPNGQGGSGYPAGLIDRAGWDDPLAMPQEYLAIPKGEFGEPDKNKLSVIPGMRRWLDVQKAAELEWRQRFRKVGQKQYKDAFDPKLHETDEVLMDITGPKPWPGSEAITRALKGEKGLLGLEPMNTEQRKLLGKETLEDMGFASAPTFAETNPALPAANPAPRLSYPEFVKSMKTQGITDPKEVAGHWHVYKDEAVED